MGKRLNVERQKKLEPKRMKLAIDAIKDLGFEIKQQDATEIQFEHLGHTVKYYPYSGWASGKTIKDGRGLENLLSQIKKQ